MLGALVLFGGALGYVQMSGESQAAVEDYLPDTLGPEFYELEPLLAPVMEGRRIGRYVLLVITLELSSQWVKPRAYKLRTPLRDALLQDLHFQAQMRGDGEGPINLTRIKARFLVLSRRILGADAVDDVLITQAFDRGY